MAFELEISGYREILRNRTFRLFWTSFTLSAVGDAITRVALTWHVWEITQSEQSLAWLAFFFTAPVIIGGLLAGWLLDRFNRPRVMAIDNLVRGLVVASLPALHLMEALELWHIYAVAAFYGLLMMVSLAGGPALIPALVAKEQLSTANALEMLSFTLSGVIAPPLTGLLILRVGAPAVIVLDALTYWIFAAALAWIWRQDKSGKIAAEERPGGVGEAVRLIRRDRILLSTTLMYMVANLGLGMAFVWLPIYSDQVLGGGAALYGTLLGILAFGELLGSVAAGAIRFGLTLGELIVRSQFLSGLALALLLTQSLVPAAVGLALFGLFSAPLTIWAQTLRMDIIPERLRGRTFALLRMLMQGTHPLGGLIGGLLLPVAGMAAAIGLSAGLVGIPGLVGSRIRELREHRVET